MPGTPRVRLAALGTSFRLVGAGPLDRDALVKELGDCLWYIGAFATVLDVSLEEIAQRNIDKLRKRYPDGFDPDRSRNRTE